MGSEIAEGWRGSVDRKLPRAPAIYERKTKWPRDDPELALQPEWQTNYSSLREHEQQVLKQVEEEVEEGMVVRMSLGQALDRYGDALVIAATGAIAKKNDLKDGCTVVCHYTYAPGDPSAFGGRRRGGFGGFRRGGGSDRERMLLMLMARGYGMF